MTASSFISRRLSFKGRAAVVSIAVSFFVVILALGISDGFRREIRSGLSYLGGDIRITRMSVSEGSLPAVEAGDSLIASLTSIPGVVQLRHAVYGSGVVRNGDSVHGVLFKGVESQGVESNADTASMDVVIPRRLSSLLGLSEGDRMLSYFISDKVAVRNFRVGGTYDAVVTGDDRMVVMCDINSLRRVNLWPEDHDSAIELVLDPELSTEKRLSIAQDVAYMLYEASCEDELPLISSSIEESYPQLFDWLRLISYNSDFILILMVIVAAFNMVSGLLILLFEHISTIGLLKSMGMTFKGISRTFLLVSGRIVLYGMVAGNVAGIALCMVQKYTHVLKLNPENYFISFVPVSLDIPAVLLCDAAAFVVIMLILLIPCRFIAGVDPARTVSVR